MISHHAVLLRVAEIGTFSVPEPETEVSQSIIKVDKFGIADAKNLITAAHRTPSNDTKEQQIVVVTSFITSEAQQALLKVLEEPPLTTKFLFVVPASLQFLPTLLSRFAVDQNSNSGEAFTCNVDSFKAFQEASVGDRIAQVETAQKAKDSIWQNEIKCGLIDYLNSQTGMYSKQRLETLHYVASTLMTRGASNKMLLEQLALTL